MAQVHIALMGDPTLRMHVVAPPSEVTCASRDAGAGVSVAWKASNEPVEGYYLYRAANPAGPFERISPSLVKETAFNDLRVAQHGITYMVRAVKLETSGGGTYFNPSQGAFCSMEHTLTPSVAVGERSIPSPTGKAAGSESQKRSSPVSGTGNATNVIGTITSTDNSAGGGL